MTEYRIQPVQTVVLAPNVAQDIYVPIGGRRDWFCIVANDGASSVDGGTTARSPDGTHYEDPVVIPGASLPDAGKALTIDGEASPIATLRLALVSTLGTTLTISLGGS